MAAEVTLEQLIKRMIPSDRLIIEDENGKELYKGYVGCMEHIDFQTSRRVKRFGLSTNIFRKETSKKGILIHTLLGEEISAEHTSEFSFSDLVMQIFTKVIVED